MMRTCFVLAASVGVLVCMECGANGWASGQNFVPVVRESVARDGDGHALTLAPGAPVYVQFTDAGIETWARWDQRPFERQVTLPEDALPYELAGFRKYHAGEFAAAAEALAGEAADESQPLVAAWKWVLAGHSNGLKAAADCAAARAQYRRAAELSSPFQLDAQYCVVRSLLLADRHEEALTELRNLEALAPHAKVPFSTLFHTYPEHSPLTAWMHGLADVHKARDALEAYITAKKTYDTRSTLPTDEAKAGAMYRFAMAEETLWKHFPERFFDNSSPPAVPMLLTNTFEAYPHTEGAARAYYHHLNYRQYWDFHGEQIEWERQQAELLEDYLAAYPNGPDAPEVRERLEDAKAYIAQHGG